MLSHRPKAQSPSSQLPSLFLVFDWTLQNILQSHLLLCLCIIVICMALRRKVSPSGVLLTELPSLHNLCGIMLLSHELAKLRELPCASKALLYHISLHMPHNNICLSFILLPHVQRGVLFVGFPLFYIMDTKATCPVCHAQLVPKVNGLATPNFDRAFLACPNDKLDNRHQGAFRWTEPPKHVSHDWPLLFCLYEALTQIKHWVCTYSFKWSYESGSSCKFSQKGIRNPKSLAEDPQPWIPTRDLHPGIPNRGSTAGTP